LNVSHCSGRMFDLPVTLGILIHPEIGI